MPPNFRINCDSIKATAKQPEDGVAIQNEEIQPEVGPVAELKPITTPGSSAVQDGSGVWCLQLPAGPPGSYRLAQLDDYASFGRANFPWQVPCCLSLEARACTSATIPGTWGFGLWNDPFSLSLGMGGGVRRFPALPNAAWFFFASPPNYLSFRDDLPAQGNLAMTFRSPGWPGPGLALAVPLLPLAVIPAVARFLRRLARRVIQQASVEFHINLDEWHHYKIEWQPGRAVFVVDGANLLETAVSPIGHLGVVIWIDNQFAAFPPDGRLRYGTLENAEKAWIEIKNIQVSTSL